MNLTVAEAPAVEEPTTSKVSKKKSEKKEKKAKKEKKSEKKSKRKRTESESATDESKVAKTDSVTSASTSTTTPTATTPTATTTTTTTTSKGFVDTTQPTATTKANDFVSQLHADASEIKIEGADAPASVNDFTIFPQKLQTLLKSQGFTQPTPIQMTSWPIAIAGRDIIAVAKTGSGKTLGYALPILMHLRPRRDATKWGDAPIALILAPTRELANQIETETRKISDPCHIRVKCVYGGVPRGEQIRSCREGMDVVVATPGRLIDFAEFNQISLDKISLVTLDEADRMLDMGFEPDIRKIMGRLPEGYQTLLYTATWPKKVRKLASEFLKNPISVHIGNTSNELVASKNIEQIVQVVPSREKNKAFFELMTKINTDEKGFAKKENAKCIVFSGTKHFCDTLCKELRQERFAAQALHGNMLQEERDRTLLRFRENKFKILVATDVCARGLDITDIEYVINYDCPLGMDDYIHRIGRTGRADNKGTAYTLFTPEKDRGNAAELVKILTNAGAVVPAELQAIAGRGGGRGGQMPHWKRRGGGRGGGRRGGGRGGGGRGRGRRWSGASLIMFSS